MYTAIQKARQKYSDKQFNQFHKKAQQVAWEFKQKETELIEVLQKVYTTRTFQHFGFRSLFNYALESLKLSESQSYMYTSVAKTALQYNELDLAIKEQGLSISKAHRIVSVIDTDNQTEWVKRAQQLTKRELEKQVAKKNPRSRVPDHIKVLAENLHHLQGSIDDECHQMITRVSELLNSKRQYQKDVAKLNEILKTCLGEYIERHDPVVKAERIISKRAQQKENSEMHDPAVKAKQILNKKANQNEKLRMLKPNKGKNMVKLSGTKIKNSARAENRRVAIPQKIKHQVLLRDQGRCQYKVSDRHICGEKSFVELHHKKPISLGGVHSVQNLVTVCSFHHKTIHS